MTQVLALPTSITVSRFSVWLPMVYVCFFVLRWRDLLALQRSASLPARSRSWLSPAGFAVSPGRIRIHDYLVLVTQVHRIQLLELRPPLLHVGDIDLEVLQEIRRAQMHQHRALRIGDGRLHVVGIGQVDVAEFARIVRAARSPAPASARVDLHARRARGERLGVGHADNHGERIALSARSPAAP